MNVSHRDAAIALLDSLQGKPTRDNPRDTLLAALVHATLATIPDDPGGVILPREAVAYVVRRHQWKAVTDPVAAEQVCMCGWTGAVWSEHVADEIARVLE